MAPFPRYAIYYVPPAGTALDGFGANLLGYDAWTGQDLAFPEQVTKTVPNWRDVTSDPRKYGFHATLKAPFAFAPGRSEDELLAACATFAATPRAIPVINPVVDARVNAPCETETLPVGGALALGGEFAPTPAGPETFGVTLVVTAGVM